MPEADTDSFTAVIFNDLHQRGNVFQALLKQIENVNYDFVVFNAHTHRFAYHPKGSLGNNYPAIIGGGNRLENATVIILEKKKGEMSIKVLDTEGKTLLQEIF